MCESWQKDEDKLTFIIVENSSGYLDDNDDVRGFLVSNPADFEQ